MNTFIKVTQLILSLSILVILHELGHFIPAKLFKTKVERFFLFFDPWFCLFKKKIGNTIYGIGWLPLGGYVKISGIINENNNNLPKKYDFRSKSALKRLIIIIGGIFMNILFAILIFTGLLFFYGEFSWNLKNYLNNYGIIINDLGVNLGFKNGDKIINIDDKNQFSTLKELHSAIILSNNIKILRDKKIINIKINNQKKRILFNKKELGLFLIPRLPIIIKNFNSKLNNNIGIKNKDKIISINSYSYISLNDLKNIFLHHKNHSIIAIINRNGIFFKKIIKIDKYGNTGINFYNMNYLNVFYEQNNSLIKNIYNSIIKVYNIFIEQLYLFIQIFNPYTNAYKQVGSIFSMVKVFPSHWDWIMFWTITANLSIWLAFINLLPIPSLDGGHAIFIIIELIFNFKINHKIIKKINHIGMIIMTLIMIIIISWDTIKNFFIYK